MPQSKKPLYLIIAILLLLAGIKLIEMGMVVGGGMSFLGGAIIFHRSYRWPES